MVRFFLSVIILMQMTEIVFFFFSRAGEEREAGVCVSVRVRARAEWMLLSTPLTN